MMTKKSLNITSIILYVITLVLLWIDGTYKMIGKSVYGTYRGSTSVSFIDAAVDSSTIDTPIFPMGWIFVVLVLFSLIVLFFEVLEKKKFNKIISIVLSALSLVVFLIISSYISSKSGGSYEYNGDLRRSHLEMGILFYVNIVLLLITTVFNIVKNSIKEKNTNNINFNINKNNQPNIIPSSEADEIKKYKDLLDNNAITQEEFDEKKKQLLNL